MSEKCPNKTSLKIKKIKSNKGKVIIRYQISKKANNCVPLKSELWGHSRSFEMALFNRLRTSSCSLSTVTMAISCIVCEIKQYIGRKSRFFIPPCA